MPKNASSWPVAARATYPAATRGPSKSAEQGQTQPTIWDWTKHFSKHASFRTQVEAIFLALVSQEALRWFGNQSE
jgi:hypothetical protein